MAAAMMIAVEAASAQIRIATAEMIEVATESASASAIAIEKGAAATTDPGATVLAVGVTSASGGRLEATHFVEDRALEARVDAEDIKIEGFKVVLEALVAAAQMTIKLK